MNELIGKILILLSHITKSSNETEKEERESVREIERE